MFLVYQQLNRDFDGEFGPTARIGVMTSYVRCIANCYNIASNKLLIVMSRDAEADRTFLLCLV